jgi:hypothetical protein
MKENVQVSILPKEQDKTVGYESAENSTQPSTIRSEKRKVIEGNQKYLLW